MRAFPKHLLTSAERRLFDRLDTPAKVQDYLNGMPHNHSDSVRSVRRSIEAGSLHCFEGALFAAAAMWYHGQPPFLLDLQTSEEDDDHVVALFRDHDGNSKKNRAAGSWGAISATHHAILRYRDPVYKSVRELAMSYFNEYFVNDGTKTMRAFSKKPFSLLPYGYDWLFGGDELYDIGADLNDAPHEEAVPKRLIKKLRKADKVERRAANLSQ